MVFFESRLFHNFCYLSFLQGLNYILPLVTLPYISRIVGVEKFGVIVFSQALVFYFWVVTVFGFDLYLPKEVSLNRNDYIKINLLYWKVFWSRLILFFGSLLVLLVMSFSSSFIKNELDVFLFSSIFILGDIILCPWVFQGLEILWPLSIITLFGRIFYTLCVFSIVKNPSDYKLVPLIYSLSQVFSGFVAYLFFVFNLRFRPTLVAFPEIRSLLRHSSHFFLSNATIQIYLRAPMIILGFVTNQASLGIYGAAEKLYSAALGLQQNLSKVVYPRASYVLSIGGERKFLSFVSRLLFISLGLGLLNCVILSAFADKLIFLIFGQAFRSSVVVLKIFAFALVFWGLNDCLGVQTLLPLGQTKRYFFIMFIAAGLNILLSIFLIPKFFERGAALALLLTQVTISVLLIHFVVKRFKLFTRTDNNELPR